MKIAKSVIDELRAMAEIVNESAETDAIDDPQSIDAAYLRSAADKFEAGSLELTDNEREVVLAELDNWLTKDWCSPETQPPGREWALSMNARRAVISAMKSIDTSKQT